MRRQNVLSLCARWRTYTLCDISTIGQPFFSWQKPASKMAKCHLTTMSPLGPSKQNTMLSDTRTQVWFGLTLLCFHDQYCSNMIPVPCKEFSVIRNRLAYIWMINQIRDMTTWHYVDISTKTTHTQPCLSTQMQTWFVSISTCTLHLNVRSLRIHKLEAYFPYC